MMDKNLLAFLFVFVLLIGAAITLGNQDQISPVVAQAKAEMKIGAGPVQVIEQGASLLARVLLGATAAGIAAAVFTELRKAYKAWMRNSHMKRWRAGPNAQWKEQKPAQEPKLTRNDLLLLALSGKGSLEQLRTSSRLGKIRPQDNDDDGIDLEF